MIWQVPTFQTWAHEAQGRMGREPQVDFTMDLLIALVILDVNHKWSIQFLGCRTLEAAKSVDFPLDLGWSRWSPSIWIPRSTTVARTTPIKWAAPAGISSCSPSLRSKSNTFMCLRPHSLFTPAFYSSIILGPWCSTDVRNAAVIIQPDDGSCLYHSLCHGAGAKQIRWTLWPPMLYPAIPLDSLWFILIHFDWHFDWHFAEPYECSIEYGNYGGIFP